VTVSFAFGGGLVIGSGSSGTIGAASLRLGHVATPETVITLEGAFGTFQHRQAKNGPTLLDTSESPLAGALYYVGPSIWIRGALGANWHTIDNGTMGGKSTAIGAASAVGAGVDLIRRHFWVLGLEVFSVATINRDGTYVTGAMCLGLSHY